MEADAGKRGIFTIAEPAAKERLEVSYLARVLRLVHLAPAIVEAWLRQLSEMTVAHLLEPYPAVWGEQLVRIDQVTFRL